MNLSLKSLASAVLLMPPTVTGNQAPDPPSPVLPLTAQVEGRGYAELSSAWWQWAHSQPLPPYMDPDGRFCDLGQEGPVWFLAGTDGTFTARRKCVVPEGKHLFLPVINMYMASRTGVRASAPSISCKQLQADAAVNNDALLSAVVTIDGVLVPDVVRFRVRTPNCFNPYPSLQQGKGYREPIAASDGYWLLLAPLPKGRHTISVGANYGDTDSAFGNMVQNFEYEISVGGEFIFARL